MNHHTEFLPFTQFDLICSCILWFFLTQDLIIFIINIFVVLQQQGIFQWEFDVEQLNISEETFLIEIIPDRSRLSCQWAANLDICSTWPTPPGDTK